MISGQDQFSLKLAAHPPPENYDHTEWMKRAANKN
jgi:hypothetical protein